MTVLSTAYLLGADVIEKHFTLDKTLKGNDHYHAGDPLDFRTAIDNFNLIQTIRGIDEKTVLPCEIIPRREARRSIVLTRDLKAGTTLSMEHLTFKRPGTGIAPKYLDIVIGKQVKRSFGRYRINMGYDLIKNKMKILAVIPARAGSKGIPNKNIRLIHNKPLIYYAIQNALNSRYITDVVVSTDSPEVEIIASQMNVNVKREILHFVVIL